MKQVTIIGGGIIGLSCAFYLQKEGCEVTVIDHDNIHEGSSNGNAGMIVPSHIIPFAAPGMISKGIKWMFNSESPFYVKPRLSGDLIKWGWRFYKSATDEHVRKSIPVLRDISFLSRSLYSDLSKELDNKFLFSERGLMMLYKTESVEKEEIETAHLANKYGVIAEILSPKQVQEKETEIEVKVRGGIFFPGDAHLNPNILMSELRKNLIRKNVKLVSGKSVLGFEKKGSTITDVFTSESTYQTDEVIIATGAWSPLLTKQLGISLLIQAGKGYSFTLDDVKKNVQIPSILLEARVPVTPMGDSLRFGGTMEITNTDLSINEKRVNGIVKSIPVYYPEMKIESPEIVWSGLRPCSPDGLPYIGRVCNFSNVVLATGHGMMGLSLGPGTGKLVSEVICGKKLSMGIEPFRTDRF